jgi:dTDP-4-dehydrorhamnose reductase
VTEGASLRTLITGAHGQLGLELRAMAPPDWPVVGYGADGLDVTRAEDVREVIRRDRPEVVIHAAAYTGVDAAEREPSAAEAVNVQGAANVARAVKEIGGRLIFVSTDFVFDGRQGRPYLPSDAPTPLGVYGRSKLMGEREVSRILGDRGLIVRTAWLYSGRGHNFVLTMLLSMREQSEVRVVCDQVGTPTWARTLAQALWTMAARPAMSGIHHWTDAGVASWYDFAIAIEEEALRLGLLERAVPVRPISTSGYPTDAKRPACSVLDKTATWAALDLPVRHWRVNLRCMLEGLAGG